MAQIFGPGGKESFCKTSLGAPLRGDPTPSVLKAPPGENNKVTGKNLGKNWPIGLGKIGTQAPNLVLWVPGPKNAPVAKGPLRRRSAKPPKGAQK